MTAEMAGQQVVDPVAPAEGEQPEAQPQVDAVTPESEAQTDKPDKGNAVQKRIDQLTWKAHEAERRANAAILGQQAAEQQAQQLWQQQQEYVRRATTPRLEQYNFDQAAYAQAVEAHNQSYFEQQRQALEQQVQRQQAAQAQHFHAQRLNARVAEGNQKYPDFESVVTNPSLPPLASVNPVLMSAIVEDDDSADILYYLGKNPGEAHRIAALPPAKAIKEIGKVADRLSRTPTRQTSQAPAPAATVGGNQRASNGLSDSDSIEEWMAKRNKQLRKR